MPAKTKRPTKPPVPSATTYPTLGGAALDAVGIMNEVILDASVPNERRWQLDEAAKALWAAIRAHRAWERCILAKPTTATLRPGVEADLGPIAATCADCGDQALIVGEPKGPGLAICRRCSFEDRG